MFVPEVEIRADVSMHGLDAATIRAVLTSILQDASVISATISLAIVGNEESRQVHARFLGSNQPTDVISFSLGDDPSRLEGELVVNSELAAERASQFGWAPEHELLLYIVHGMLHLVGYDDSEPGERDAMFARQREILCECGIPANLVNLAVACPSGP